MPQKRFQDLSIRNYLKETEGKESVHLSYARDPIQHGNGVLAIENEVRDRREEKRRTSFLQRRFSSKWKQKREDGNNNDIRGPLGLRLLSASPEPMVEIIFVHGLRGGSVKTWQKGNDPRLYWPQHWLPTEPDFRNASIYSFGYDSDWKSSEPSILNIHDFGQALYEELRSSPSLQRNPKSPILLVGHSMGGLVIKKAYILAHQDTLCSNISERIRSIFFLATPHRGSDYAPLLNNILKVSQITGVVFSREYVDELSVGSRSTQKINDEFGKYSMNLAIFSFYETLQTDIGLSSSIIVDKHSAILGYGNERVTYLNANHGNMCKFMNPGDPNYLTLKNSLGITVQILLSEALQAATATSTSELQSIKSFLCLPDQVIEYYDRLEGTCQWIDDREDFKEWRDSSQGFNYNQKHKVSIYWVTANPGAGKTVLAAHAVSQLSGFGLESAVYHFDLGKKESQTVSGFLRSIALQMAQSNAAVRKALVKMSNQQTSLDLDDPRAIWARLFQAGIFQIETLRSQFWIIDAIDECLNYPGFFSLLRDTTISFPLKIFITCRKLIDMPRLVRQLSDAHLTVIDILPSDTMADIRLYVQSRILDLPVGNASEKLELIEDIIARSNASFLWVRLVMDELEGVYGYETVAEVLRGIPEGMLSYYQRAVKEMSENKRERHISKAILRWVALASEPLTLLELSHAVELDVKTSLADPQSAIQGLCAHIVVVDGNTGVVRILHNTAREFLFSEAAGDFEISKSEGHDRIASICLGLLVGPSMHPPRHKRVLEQTNMQLKIEALLEYAIIHFSEHVFNSSASNDELAVSLDKFFSTTTLTWIERLLKDGTIHRLIRASRDLKAYLDRRSKYSSPSDRRFNSISLWITDLSRLAIKFSGALSISPQSIYFLVPPFCPKKTALHRQVRPSPNGLKVLGLDDHWDDCIATLSFGDKTAARVACGETLIAVGFENGDVYLYNPRSYEVEAVIKNELSMGLIYIDPQGSFIVISSHKYLTLWSIQGVMAWRVRLRSHCILLTSCSTFILGITQQGKALKWDIITGEVDQEHHFVYQPPSTSEIPAIVPSKAPSVASVSPTLELLALAYRNGPVCIYDLQNNDLMGWAIESKSRAPEQIMFNPNPDMNLLLVAYNESHLALFDSWSGTLLHEQDAKENVILNSLTCSKNGHTFATVDICGRLRIWDFESLTLLYHILTPSQSFRLLSLTPDGFALLDMTEHELKIWSPSALMRKTVEGEASTTDCLEVRVVPEKEHKLFQSSRISAAVAHPVLHAVFVGRNNGDVCFYNAKDEQRPSVLYCHGDTVNHIATCNTNIIASSDLYQIVQVRKLLVGNNGIIKAEQLEFQLRLHSPIQQLVLDIRGDYLLVSTAKADHVYKTIDGSLAGSLVRSDEESSIRKWVSLPITCEMQAFGLIHNDQFTSYGPSNFSESESAAIRFDFGVDQEFDNFFITIVAACPATSRVAVEICHHHQNVSKTRVSIFQPGGPPSETSNKVFTSTCIPLSIFKQFLGFTSDHQRVVFLSRSFWVCSVPVETSANTSYTQHFYIPSEYITSSDILPTCGPNDTFAFPLHDKLIIVKNGLSFCEEKRLEDS